MPPTRILQILQHVCIGCGLLLVSVATIARLGGEIDRQEAVASFRAVEFTPVPVEPETEAVAVAPAEMPKTASQLPLLGVFGVALLAVGAGFAFPRRRSTNNS